MTLDNFRLKFTGLATAYFRFDIDQMLQLRDLLQVLYFGFRVEYLIVCYQMPPDLLFNGYRTTSIEALCVSLHKLASQCRWTVIARSSLHDVTFFLD